MFPYDTVYPDVVTLFSCVVVLCGVPCVLYHFVFLFVLECFSISRECQYICMRLSVCMYVPYMHTLTYRYNRCACIQYANIYLTSESNQKLFSVHMAL